MDRAVFKWLSKIITGLQLLHLMTGLKSLHHFLNQWEAKLNPIAPCVRFFSHALSKFQVMAFSPGIWKPL